MQLFPEKNRQMLAGLRPVSFSGFITPKDKGNGLRPRENKNR